MHWPIAILGPNEKTSGSEPGLETVATPLDMIEEVSPAGYFELLGALDALREFEGTIRAQRSFTRSTSSNTVLRCR